ncbi:MAG: hypothetical protein ACE5G9_03490 [Nitrospinales bacterium]
MDEPKNEPIPLNQRQDFKVCLNCGFPNRHSDSHCMYCNTSLKEDSGLFSWLRQTYYVLRWRWDLKQKREDFPKGDGRATAFSLKTLWFFFLGSVLSGVGIYLFAYSIERSSFSSCVIAILFLLYGFYTLRTLFVRR